MQASDDWWESPPFSVGNGWKKPKKRWGKCGKHYPVIRPSVLPFFHWLSRCFSPVLHTVLHTRFRMEKAYFGCPIPVAREMAEGKKREYGGWKAESYGERETCRFRCVRSVLFMFPCGRAVFRKGGLEKTKVRIEKTEGGLEKTEVRRGMKAAAKDRGRKMQLQKKQFRRECAELPLLGSWSMRDSNSPPLDCQSNALAR